MRDEGTEIFFPMASVVEIDAEEFKRIIIKTCRASDERATKAANQIIDHLIKVHRQATRKQ